MPDTRKGIQSIEIGFRLVEALERASHPLGLTELARTNAISLSSARFYLVSLMRVGLVSQSTYGGRYNLGPAALRLGLAALSQTDPLELARAELSLLAEKTGDTVFLSVWGEQGPVVVNRVDGDRMAPLGIRVGSIMPVTHSATGKVFLAYLPRSVTRPFARKELKTNGPSLNRTVERLAAEVREHGLAQNLGGVTLGIAAIAAPVVDYEGAVRCVLTLMGREGKLDIEPAGRPGKALRATARKVSRAAGFDGDIWQLREDYEAFPAAAKRHR